MMQPPPSIALLLHREPATRRRAPAWARNQKPHEQDRLLQPCVAACGSAG